MHTGVIWPRGVNIGNRPLIEAKMKGCQVRDWIVGEIDMSFSPIFIYDMCRWGLINVYNLQWPPTGNQLVVSTHQGDVLDWH